MFLYLFDEIKDRKANGKIKKKFLICTDSIPRQESITRSVQLPYSPCETAFSQVGLFLDKPFPRIGFQ